MLALRPHARRVLALDLPAHGFSAVPERGLTVRSIIEAAICQAFDAILTEPSVVVGNSLGGAPRGASPVERVFA